MNPWNSNYKSHQGNVGLGMAIAYYTSICVPVMIPLNDTQKYDLVVELDGKLKKVQIKTTRGKSKSGKYAVQLKHSGGSDNKKAIVNFDNTESDILFVVTIDGDLYQIPSEQITAKTQLILSEQWNKFKVSI